MKYFLLFTSIFFSAICIAQTNTETTDPVFTIVEQMPSFPGGELEMMKFIQQNVKYPEAEKAANVSGTSYVTFVVEKDGSITNVKTIRGVTNGPGCDKEAIRVVSIMPKWTGGKQNGREVRVQYNLPVKFTLRTTPPVAVTDTLYFDKDWNRCLKVNASYFRVMEKQGDAFLVKDIYFESKRPQMIAVCSSIDPLVNNGKATYYFEDGIKKKEGDYEKNTPVGQWIVWDRDGKDSSVFNYNKETYIRYDRITDKLLNSDEAFDIAEVMPAFPGGEAAMMQFIQTAVVYPKKEQQNNISGTCYVQFIVEKDGTLGGIRILRGVANGPGCDEESMRVVRLMPKWTPGKIKGKNVRVKFNLPIKFTLR